MKYILEFTGKDNPFVIFHIGVVSHTGKKIKSEWTREETVAFCDERAKEKCPDTKYLCRELRARLRDQKPEMIANTQKKA